MDAKLLSRLQLVSHPRSIIPATIRIITISITTKRAPLLPPMIRPKRRTASAPMSPGMQVYLNRAGPPQQRIGLVQARLKGDVAVRTTINSLLETTAPTCIYQVDTNIPILPS